MASTTRPEYQASHPMSQSREGRMAEWARDNGRALGIVATSIAVLAVGGVAWRSSERAKADRAEQAFFQAQGGTQGDPAATERALRPLLARYQGTAGGTQAGLLLAQSLYDQGKFQDGLAVLARLTPPEQFRDAVRLLTAAGYEGTGRAGEAARIYIQLADRPDVVARRRDELRAAAARAYQLSGDRASALRLWKTLAASGTGPTADEARIRVGELEARS